MYAKRLANTSVFSSWVLLNTLGRTGVRIKLENTNCALGGGPSLKHPRNIQSTVWFFTVVNNKLIYKFLTGNIPLHDRGR